MSPKFGVLFASFLAFISPLMAQTPPPVTAAEAEVYGMEVYIYGYPLVAMEMTRRVMTNVTTPQETKAPMGQFSHMRHFPDASSKELLKPNTDTLTSRAWVDLSKEAYVLSLPDMGKRYFLFEILSGWTNVIESIGSRTTGASATKFVLIGPNWKGELPKDIKVIQSPTDMVWIIGRICCTASSGDYDAVHALQDHSTLTPLSYYGKAYTPPKGKIDLKTDMKTKMKAQIRNLDSIAFFKLFSELLKTNPPAPEDGPMLNKMEKIGIVIGKEYQTPPIGSEISKALKSSHKRASKKISSYEKATENSVNGWEFSLKTGKYGTNYLQRAVMAYEGLGTNLPEDAVYFFAFTDDKERPLTGTSRYVIHFDRGQTPPVQGYWSLTLYDNKYHFVKNPLSRFSLSPRDPLQYNPDGSLDLYLQTVSPGKANETNWLPCPSEDFNLMLRTYWPERSILNGGWKPPFIKRVE